MPTALLAASTKSASSISKSVSLFIFTLLATVTITSTPPMRTAAACAAVDTSRGQVNSSFNVPLTATYRVWSRIKTQTAANNSFILQVDGSQCNISVGGGSGIPVNTWTWVSYRDGITTTPLTMNLASGGHTMSLIGSKDGVSVDRVIYTTDTTCLPTGNGDNCATPPTPVAATPTPTSSTTTKSTNTAAAATNKSGAATSSTSFAGTTGTSQTVTAADNSSVSVTKPITIQPATTLESGVTKVEYYLNNKLIRTVTKPPYSFDFNPAQYINGSYELVSKTFYSNGTTKKSTQHLEVKNASAKRRASTWIIPAVIIATLAALTAALFTRRRLQSSHPTSHNDAEQETMPTIITPDNKE
jgi:hypothetical protein